MTTKRSYAAKIAAGVCIRCQDRATHGRHCEQHAARILTPLGMIVVAWRAQHSVSQAHAARLFGISRVQLSLIETGKRTGKYSEKQIRAVCALGAPTVLFAKSHPPTPLAAVLNDPADNDADASLLDAALSAMEG